MKEKKELKNRVEISEEKAVQALDQPDYIGEILSLIRSNTSPIILREKLDDYHENDIADALPQLQPNERQKLYRILDPDLLAAILEYAEEDEDALYLSEMDIHRAASVVSEMDSDDAVSVLKTLPKERRALVIDLMDSDSKHDIKLMASYDDDEIGSRMTTNCIIIRENLSVKEAMSELVRQAGENDNISTLFTVDEDGEFYGAIDLKELIIARGDQSLDDLIVTSFPYVYGHEEIDDCIERLKDYSEDSIPVLDNNNRILGVITSQNLTQLVDEELGEDYAKLGGLTAEEDLKEPVSLSVKKRLPWLVLLLFLGMVVSSVVSLYEGVVEKLTIIMAFQSMILDMSGNVGTQSLAVTIRVLTDRGINGRMKLKLIRKEMTTGAANGFLVGCVAVVGVGIYIMLAHHMAVAVSLAISICIGSSLLLAMVISSFVGTIIPMFFDKIGVDPAVASGPLITTITDLVGVVTYYSLAWIMLVHFLGM
ncbi:MAG TPA: magnesium transporter [Lachnospiraceae bacterium]|nr:magnesium transporter [Lachnospiraceae bacterium]